MRIGRALVRGEAREGTFTDDGFVPTGQTTAVALAPDDHLSPVMPRNVLVILAGFRPEGSPMLDGPPDLGVKGVSVGPSGDHGVIRYPELGSGAPIAVEAELAAVIGTEAHCVGEDDIWSHVAGFTVMNDVTAFEFMPTAPPTAEDWMAAARARAYGLAISKSFDTFCSIGPWIVDDLTADAIAQGLTIETRVNGETRGVGTTARFKRPVARVVSHASFMMTLHPGDVVSLGTPGNVPVQVGDEIEIDIDGVGVLHNRVVA